MGVTNLDDPGEIFNWRQIQLAIDDESGHLLCKAHRLCEKFSKQVSLDEADRAEASELTSKLVRLLEQRGQCWKRHLVSLR